MVPARDDAIDYQQACAALSKPCPTIVCLDGNRIESSSFSDPDASLSPDAALPFVFGALPAVRTREWEAANRAAEACGELCSLLEEKKRLQDQVTGTETESQAKQQDVDSIKAQLDQARRDAAGAAHPPSSPAASAAASGGPRGNKRAGDNATATTTKRARHDSA